MKTRTNDPHAPVRMKDIARDLGLSVVTVSKVFRGHCDISEETRRRVLSRIAELNYRPNQFARSLATGRSFTMSFVAPDLVHPFFAEVARNIATILRSKGYYLLMSSSEEEQAVEQLEIERLLSGSVDVLLIASSRADAEALQPIRKRKLPLILIDRNFPELNAHFVGVDDEVAGVMATEHLLQQGYRNIAHITSPAISTSVGRYAGYRKALTQAGVPVRPEYVIMRAHGDATADETGYEAMERLLQMNPRPDAVFCHNDPTALGAMKAILNAGLRIPEDIAVAGCGNIRYSDFLRIPLTTVDQNCEGIGQAAAKLALSLLDSPQETTKVLLQPRLIVRESTHR